MVRITWHGHSCFTVSAEGFDIVFDPYEPDSVPGYEPLDLIADQVLCSHGHADHACEYVVWIREEQEENPFRLKTIDTWHDPEQGKLRGPNRIHLLSGCGLKIAHFGDLGCSLTAEQKKQLAGIDVAMIPVGGFYTIDAAQAEALLEELKPRIILPMHYRGEDFGYPVLSPLAEFTGLRRDVQVYDTDTIEVDRKTPAQTAVLRYPAPEDKFE